jgi:hypothetical protein
MGDEHDRKYDDDLAPENLGSGHGDQRLSAANRDKQDLHQFMRTDGGRSGTTIGASSAASFTCYNRGRDGAIGRVNTAPVNPVGRWGLIRAHCPVTQPKQTAPHSLAPESRTRRQENHGTPFRYRR